MIGSFNLHSRSLDLNTELGFIIDSAALAGAVHDAYSRNVPLIAWLARSSPWCFMAII